MTRRPPHRLVVLVLAAALALVLGACGGGDDDEAAPADLPAGTVLAGDNYFEPETIEIGVGETVTWRFVGAALHNVTGSGFQSENLREGTYEHTFEEPGRFDYVCTLHPGMKGTVVVS